MDFKQYRRKKITELRPVSDADILEFHKEGWFGKISISDEDIKNGSPKIGDMIARNPKNHNDKWLVAKEYFEDNFEIIEEHDQSCISCGEEHSENTCTHSERECGHHCNHSWIHDECCWCGEEF